MNKIFATFFIALLISLASFSTARSQNTSGTLTFTVKTISNNLGYSPKHVLSIWIKNAQGNFISSCKVMANARKKHLVKWVASSNYDVTNAITGSTLSQHTSHTITWNAKNSAGSVVPDGTYQVWVEYTNQNSANGYPAGPSTSVEFVKDGNTLHLVPASQTYFTNMVLDWVPDNPVGMEEEKIYSPLSVFPNPFSGLTNIRLALKEKSQVQASVCDMKGKKVSDLAGDILPAGNFELSWDGKDNSGNRAKEGVYLLVVTVNGIKYTEKLMFSK